MADLPIEIEQKLNDLPIVSFNDEEAFTATITSSLFTDIFTYYINTYADDTIKSQSEILQRVSLYLNLTNQAEELVDQSENLIYRRPVPSMEEFLDGGFYMGPISNTIYPYWRKLLIEIFKPNSPIRKVLWGGATGVGKSRTAEKAALYALYRLLCLRYPRQILNVEASSTLAMFMGSVTQKTAYQVLFTPFLQLMKNMKCFQRVQSAKSFDNFDLNNPNCPFPYMVEKANDTIVFPDNIIITTGSQISNTVGYDIVISSLDELNEKGVEEGMRLLNSVDGRLESRFMGSEFIFQNVMSSARDKNSVTSEYNKKWRNSKEFFYSHPMRFEVKQTDDFVGDGSYFYIMVSYTAVPSKIITDPGEILQIQQYEDKIDNHEIGELLDFELIPGSKIIRVPTIYRNNFEGDLVQQIQDTLGIETQSTSIIFRDTSKLENLELCPELHTSAELGDNTSLIQLLPKTLFEENKLKNKFFLKRAPNADRYIHLDLAGDGQCDAALSMIHKEWALNPITNQKETIFVTDFLMFINAKNKLDLTAIKRLCEDLVLDFNISIHTISADQYQSKLILNEFEMSGLFQEVKKISVDSSLEPYMSTAALIESNQVKAGQCPKLKKELEALIIEKGKVTRTTELKDGADALVGAIYNAQIDFANIPTYQYISDEHVYIEVNYEDLIDTDNEFLKPL